MQTEMGGLSLLPKLKYEHIYLTSFSKMRVNLAAQVKYFAFFPFLKVCVDCCTIMFVSTLQVLSESVGHALSLFGGPEVEETAKFALMFDKFLIA